MDLTYRKTGVQHRYGNTYVGYRAPLEVVDFPHPPALAVVTTVHVGDFSSSCTGNATDLHAIMVHRIRGVIRLLLLSTGSFYPPLPPSTFKCIEAHFAVSVVTPIRLSPEGRLSQA